ncbi:MAG: hypothetical protein AAGF97_15825 [Planctomycetota bacterium]
MKVLSIALLVLGFVVIGISFVIPRVSAGQVDAEQLEEYDQLVLDVHNARTEGSEESQKRARENREKARAMSTAWEESERRTKRLTSVSRAVGLVLAIAGGLLHAAVR